jgi:hypothetical protein
VQKRTFGILAVLFLKNSIALRVRMLQLISALFVRQPRANFKTLSATKFG